MIETFSSLIPQQLRFLDPQEAIRSFRELLWAEASYSGVGKALISVPDAIYAPDGGTDAHVRAAPQDSKQGVFKKGLTYYQVKTGQFDLGPASLRKLLVIGRPPSLRPRLRTCFEKGGTFILVLFGRDKRDDTAARLKEELVQLEPGFSDASIEVWGQTELCGFLSPFPSLVLRLNNRLQPLLQPHSSWALQDDMTRQFVGSPELDCALNQLREGLRQDLSAVHIRVLGEPGIGKTRLVLEATSADDLKPLVIYCDSPMAFMESRLLAEFLTDDSHLSAIIVLDDCDVETRAGVWNKLKHRGSRVKLVTISSEPEETSGTTQYLVVPPLPDAQISDVIRKYDVARDEADRWARFCGGSPRVAHVIGLNLKDNPDDVLREPDTVTVWERFIVGGDKPDDIAVRQRRTVLEHLSLFKRFGFGPHFRAHVTAIVKVIEKADKQISEMQFAEIVKTLRARRILQGEHVLYISPKLFHVWLWTRWWDKYGGLFDYASFCSGLPDLLQEWFNDMFRYSAASPMASRTVLRLFETEEARLLSNERWARFFRSLVEASPEAALEYLAGTLGKQSKEELTDLRTARREVVESLRLIAVHRNLFLDAARLLLALAEAENEAWANNATGVFASLFSPAPAPFAPTQVPPDERLPALVEALSSHSDEKRMIALRACNAGLETGMFVSVGAPQQQGARRGIEVCGPRSREELVTYYRKVWQMVRERLQSTTDRQASAAVLLERAQQLVRLQALAPMVLETLQEMVEMECAPRHSVLSTVTDLVRTAGADLPLKEEWECLRDRLTGADFPSLLRRYVSMPLTDDSWGNGAVKADAKLRELATDAVGNSKLATELSWLVTNQAPNGHRFGYHLGRADAGFELFDRIVSAQIAAGQESSGSFLGGYLQAMFEVDQGQWERRLDELAANPAVCHLVCELTCRSGLTDRAGERVLTLARRGAVEPAMLRVFALGGLVGELPEPVFDEWIELLLGQQGQESGPALSAALILFHSYYVRERKAALPLQRTLDLLTHPGLLQSSRERPPDQSEAYHWVSVAERFVRLHPDESPKLAAHILGHLGEECRIFSAHFTAIRDLLNQIADINPLALWSLLSKRLGRPAAGWLRVQDWLRGNHSGPGALDRFPRDVIWGWVKQQPHKRAPLLANLVPPVLSSAEPQQHLWRELLVRYGHFEDVRTSLMCNFSTEGWWGKASEHYANKRTLLRSIRASESNAKVRQWIDQYLKLIDWELERQKVHEELEADG